MLEYEGIKIELLDDVYPPEEDTLMFLEVLKREEFEQEEEALEIGSGCGILSLYLAGKVRHVTGVDINEKAVELSRKNAKNNGIENATFFVSDLFSEIEEKYDLIIFNPPYLPVTQPPSNVLDLSYHGGQDGRMLSGRFLKEFHRYLEKDGRAYLLQSSVSGIKGTLEYLKIKGHRAKILSQKNVFFEKLVVMKVIP